MAVVYMAEQEKPLRRRVALKIIKLGMDTKSVIARFEAERQALAVMDHPNIAKVFDAGTTETGRPYFVMELVRGVSISNYCDKNKLDTKERLDLFVQVCNAVQHAHQKGIIHRDIKPSNIMVTQRDGNAVPKVIDFGIAKATNQKLTEKTLFTRYAHIIGTPAYMSPEQAELSELDVDTRTDIYSLGVLLYELLTGTTPFSEEELCEAGYIEMQRIIREEEPPTPSTKLSTLGEELTDIAEHRKTNPDLLTKLTRGDLDWIVMKSLEKDRTRRYDTVVELAADVERHLNSEPVQAAAPSVSYRLRKFVRRNRVSVIAGSLVAAALLIGATVATIGFVQAKSQRNRAEANYQIAETERQRAETNLQKAEEERKRADSQATKLRQQFYAASIALASNALEHYNVARTKQLLHSDAYPQDLRGWEWERLNWLLDRSTMTIDIDSGFRTIWYVAYGPDGRTIASASGDGKIRVWDADTGELRWSKVVYEGDEGVLSVAYSPYAKLIVTGASDGKVIVWDTATGQNVRAMGNEDRVRIKSLAFSPDGKTIVTGDFGRALKLWDISSGELLYARHEHGGVIWSVAFSPDGKWIVSASEDKMVKVWDVQTGEPVKTLEGHKGEVSCAMFSPDGKQIVSAGERTLKLWDAMSGKLVMTLLGHQDWVRWVAFSPDGRQIASVSRDRTLKLWDTDTGEELVTLHGHTKYVRGVAFSPDGKTIVTTGDDATLKMWDPNTGPPQLTLRGHEELLWTDSPAYSVAVSPDGKRIVSGHAEGQVRVWDAHTGEELTNLRGHIGTIFSVAFSPDGNRIMSAGADGTLAVWDANRGRLLDKWHGHDGNIRTLAISGNGKRIATGGDDRIIKIWDADTGEELLILTGHKAEVRGIAFSPDGLRIVSGSNDSSFKVWDATTGRELVTHQGLDSHVGPIVFSRDGKRIVSGSNDKTLKVWDAETGEELLNLLGHEGTVTSLAISPDGSRIVSGSRDETVRLWDSDTGQELAVLRPRNPGELRWYRTEVYSVAFSPDGKTVLAGIGDGSIKLWESATPPGGYGPRRTVQAARKIVNGLWQEHRLYHKVIEQLRADDTFGESVREVALRIANARHGRDKDNDRKPPLTGKKITSMVASEFSEETLFTTGDFDMQVVSFDLSAYFNRDVVANSGDDENDFLDNGLSLLVEEGFDGIRPDNPDVQGLPRNRQVGLHRLSDYDGLNALQITMSDAKSIRVEIPNGHYSHIRFLVTAGHGICRIPLTFEYSDGTTQRSVLPCNDWFDDEPPEGLCGTLYPGVMPILDGMDRLFVHNFDNANDPALFEVIRNVDSQKELAAFVLEVQEALFSNDMVHSDSFITRFNLLAATGVWIGP